MLRATLDPETLAGLGLTPASPLDRAKVQRGERAELLRSVTGSKSGLESVDALRAIASARGLLERVNAESVAEWTPEEASAGVRLLADVSKRVQTLRRKVPKVTE